MFLAYKYEFLDSNNNHILESEFWKRIAVRCYNTQKNRYEVMTPYNRLNDFPMDYESDYAFPDIDPDFYNDNYGVWTNLDVTLIRHDFPIYTPADIKLMERLCEEENEKLKERNELKD